VYGIGGGTGCPVHKDKSCYICHRCVFAVAFCQFLHFAVLLYFAMSLIIFMLLYTVIIVLFSYVILLLVFI